MLRIPIDRPALALAASLLLASVAVAAGDPPPAGPGARPGDPRMSQQPKPAEKPRLVCEQVEQMGSHFRRRVCATPEAWEARRRRDAAQMERMGDQGAGCGGVANPC